MKKIYILLTGLLLTGTVLKAQDTLLYQDFELNTFYVDSLIDGNVTGTPPPGATVDIHWYSWDTDGQVDGSTTGTRPDGYFATMAFSTVDQYITPYLPGPDTNTVIGANSWSNTAVSQQNWLMTRNIKLGAHDTLFWRSAPLQGPRYEDGYQVLLSTTTNADNTSGSFVNVLSNITEMTNAASSPVIVAGTSTLYTDFTFANTGAGGPAGITHGADGFNMDAAGTTTPISMRGQLRDFSAPLDAYANKNVFIAFMHNSKDDNMISFDDVMVRGTPSNPSANINESQNELGLSVYPNPASDDVQINYGLTSDAAVTINLFDISGKLVSTTSNGTQSIGRHFAHISTSDLAKGFYTVNVTTGTVSSTTKLLIVR